MVLILRGPAVFQQKSILGSWLCPQRVLKLKETEENASQSLVLQECKKDTHCLEELGLMSEEIFKMGFEESVGIFSLFWLPMPSCMKPQAGPMFTLIFPIYLLCSFWPLIFLPSLEILHLVEMYVRTNGLCTICQRGYPREVPSGLLGHLLAELSQGQSGQIWKAERKRKGAIDWEIVEIKL